MSLEAALRDAAVSPRDDRGLMPIEDARRILADARTVERDTLDAIWAAMLSLVNGEELLERARHLEWHMPVRGMQNVALVERYGASALPWLASRVHAGVLVNHPWCVLPSLHALDDPRALELLLGVDGVVAAAGEMKYWQFTEQAWPDAAQLAQGALEAVIEWTRLHPDAARPVLERLAPTSERAAAAMRKVFPTELTEAAILETLDHACSGQGGGWPWFVQGVDGRTEYFGLRLVALRAKQGHGWAIVLERLQGCDPYSFQIARYAYGPATVNGWGYEISHSLETALDIVNESGDEARPVFSGMIARGVAGDLVLDESLFARFDLRPGVVCEYGGWAARTLAIRAYLEAHPDVMWPPPEAAVAASGLPDAEVVIATRAFTHAGGNPLDGVTPRPWHVMPSELASYRSLAAALVHRDPSQFEPGESNLDWRIHAEQTDGFILPWRVHRADTTSFLRAAMTEACVAVDARGLMPLDEARTLAAAPALARGDGRWVDKTWVWDLDRTWAALLSLEDAVECAAVMKRIRIDDPPRSVETNRALVERYGDDALAIVAAIPDTALARTTVLAVGSPRGFRFVWNRGAASELFVAWMAAHPAVGFAELARLVDGGDAAARGFLATAAAPQARKVFRWIRDGLGEDAARRVYAALGLSVELVPAHVLAALDAHAARAIGGEDPWPLLVTGAGPSRELHGLRLVAGRDGDRWVVVIERVEGYLRSWRICRYVVSEDVPSGVRPDLDVPLWGPLEQPLAAARPRDEDAVLAEPPDYWTTIDNAPAQIAAARAVLRDHPDKVWPDPAGLLAQLGFAAAPVVVTTEFAHTAGDPRPSSVPAYVAVAEAISARE